MKPCKIRKKSQIKVLQCMPGKDQIAYMVECHRRFQVVCAKDANRFTGKNVQGCIKINKFDGSMSAHLESGE